MSNIAERYTRLCRSYVQLADQFQKLDVEHMILKGKVVPLLKTLKAHKLAVESLQREKMELATELQTIAAKSEELKPLQQENVTLQMELQALTAKYEELKPFEPLLYPEIQAALMEAEEQVELVNVTLQEVAEDSDPDLSAAEKQLFSEYHTDPHEFETCDRLLPLPEMHLSDRVELVEILHP